MAIKKLYENTYRISEWGAFGPVKMYLLIGNERALLINSGYGKMDLKSIVTRITDKKAVGSRYLEPTAKGKYTTSITMREFSCTPTFETEPF